MKLVIQALPIYSMSVFKLPKGVCNDISKKMAYFWWSKDDSDNKMHWIVWGQMTETKEYCGMGFRDFEAFNHALLGKKVWKLITKPNCLCLKCWKANTTLKQTFSKCQQSQEIPGYGRAGMRLKSWIKMGVAGRWEMAVVSGFKKIIGLQEENRKSPSHLDLRVVLFRELKNCWIRRVRDGMRAWLGESLVKRKLRNPVHSSEFNWSKR